MEVDPHVNVEALRLAVKAIEANPLNWDQGSWVGVMGPASRVSTAVADVDHDFEGFLGLANPKSPLPLDTTYYVKTEDCRTTYCLAGQTLLQAGMIDDEGRYVDEYGHRVKSLPVEKIAGRLLGLSDDQADDIFYWGLSHHEDQRHDLAAFKAHITKVTGVTFED
jgi:hypothetical protein